MFEMEIDEQKLWNIEYVSQQLEETRQRANPILDTLVLNNGDINSLDPEEQYKIRNLLMDYQVYSRLLAQDIAEPVSMPKYAKLIIRKILAKY